VKADPATHLEIDHPGVPSGRREVLARAQVDAERWVDDGGSFQAGAVPSAPDRDEVMKVTARPGARYRCPCEQVFQVFGLGRHRHYYELADRGRERAVLGRVCPSCERGLPGKN
jgi:hypothetical protein